ncbi:uncharacterized protein LOC575882 [Strongylocentrotus purpuratus]|uniref:Syndecan n=1 Tax=Strongylocentrotus purpuratus TaxID=7668 RepID=A0A7M7THI0_STRPU|nr:uncharacterized protein LOC575882 [Strongylocentrotus purpuratus]|eukprot:XP_799857.1 PREDICTED: uncharacterized protein LOC575882 [Strongylocentrotus purpuratus]
MSSLVSTLAILLVTVITSTLSSPIKSERDKWLETVGLAESPGIYVGPGPVDQESSGDFASILGGLQGSGDTPSEPAEQGGFDLTDILIAVDHETDPVSFMPSSSSSSSSIMSSSSIIEASLSEYDGIDSEEDVRIEESTNDKYEGDNELGTGAIDEHDPNTFDNNMPLNPNAIPDAFQNGANAELGPDKEINKISTRAKANPNPKGVKPQPNMAGESEKSAAAGKGKTPPNVLKYTAVIGVVMVAVAVGMGALLSAIGLGAVKLVKKARKPKVEEA